MMKAIRYAWAGTTTLALLPMLVLGWALKQVRPNGLRDGTWDWVLSENGWFLRTFYKKWAATTLGVVIVYHPHAWDNARIRKHEQQHVAQAMRLGPFWLPLYGLASLAILIACPSLHYYRDNPFEVDARRASES